MIDPIYKWCREECNKSLESLRHHFSRLRTGRASVGLLDDVRVDYYGTPTPVSQVATLSAPDPRLIVISPWETSMLKPIEKAITVSDLGLNPVNDGKTIKLAIPPLSEERRKEMIKTAKHHLEECKIGIRNHRRDANEKINALAKDKSVGEDNLKRARDEIQKIHDDEIKSADKIFQQKEKELLEI